MLGGRAMGKHPENKWKAELKKALEGIGATVFSCHGHGMQAPGWPDLFVAHSIWSGWIELKMPNGRLSTSQKIVGRKLESRGIMAVLVWKDPDLWEIRDVDEVEESYLVDGDPRSLLHGLRNFTAVG